jgi:hypothetical protein
MDVIAPFVSDLCTGSGVELGFPMWAARSDSPDHESTDRERKPTETRHTAPILVDDIHDGGDKEKHLGDRRQPSRLMTAPIFVVAASPG